MVNKEQVYDEHVNPLMAQIIAVCKEHKINAHAKFLIPSEEDPTLALTTHMWLDGGDPCR